jgi:hypothetical protein
MALNIQPNLFMFNPNDSNRLKAAETSFLASMRAREGKPARGRPSKHKLILKALKENTVGYFKRILDDDTEQMLWSMFITGKFPKLGVDGQPVHDLQGHVLYEDVELNPISWNAFKQAVAYKRGTPTLNLENKGNEPIDITFTVLGPKIPDRVKMLEKAQVSEESDEIEV